jgi:hypothetical protein
MRTKYIGDSLDMAKRVLLEILADAGLRPVLCPLPSHREFDFDLFGRALGVNDKAIGILRTAPKNAFWGQYRRVHLQVLDGAIFGGDFKSAQVVVLDPDNGVHRRRRDNKVVHVDEVRDMTSRLANRVLAIYHHLWTDNLSHFEAINQFPNIPRFGYDFGAAAILFLQGPDANDVLNSAREAISNQLNPSRIFEGVELAPVHEAM